MKILCSFPGRVGDIIWSLPTARAISRHFAVPVDFTVSKKYGDAGLLKLISEQEYIGEAFAIEHWDVQETAPMSPRIPPVWPTHDYVFHLGYEGWPEGENLPESIWQQAKKNYPKLGKIQMPWPMGELEPWLDLSPWISHPAEPIAASTPRNIFVGWSQEWIELKMGVTLAMVQAFPEWQFDLVYGEGMRHEEWRDASKLLNMWPGDFWAAAGRMKNSAFYLGCLSSQWVLANAMGKHCVVVEPAEQRWHPVFWRENEKNTMVVGGGHPTFDARHAVDCVKETMGKCGF